MLIRRALTFLAFWVSMSLPAAGEEKEFTPADLPPALPWSGASETLIVDRSHPWITPAEEMKLEDSPNYPDTIAYLRRLCTASELLDLTEFGRTPEGRDLYVVIARSTKVGSGKPVVLAQAGIHSGEIDGKDAGLMLLRDIAFGGKDGLLRNVDFLFVPVFNVDGHERRSRFNRPNQRGPEIQGWRTSAQNLNLNRDYLKADTPEMQAMLGLINEWDPALYPSSPASFLKWGFFPGILQRTEYIEGYVIDPLATRMMEDDPRLEADFEAALADDPEFAGDREARLRWFYERTPYYDDRYLLYPVGVER